MSLKVLGKWKHWGASMDRKFNSIQTNLQHIHNFHSPSPASPTQSTSPLPICKKPSLPRNPTVSNVVQQHARDASPSSVDSEQDPDTDEEDYDGSELIKFTQRELEVLKHSTRKWWRLAGLKGTPKCADEMGKAELRVHWTKAIAPRVEGRIKEVKR